MRRANRVHVRIDQPRNHRAPSEIDHARLLAREAPDRSRFSERDNAPVADCERLVHGAALVGRDDLAVEQNRVEGLREGAGAGEGERENIHRRTPDRKLNDARGSIHESCGRSQSRISCSETTTKGWNRIEMRSLFARNAELKLRAFVSAPKNCNQFVFELTRVSLLKLRRHTMFARE